MGLQRIYESKSVTVNSVGFSFYVDTEPLRARFLAKSSKDLDKLATEKDVNAAIATIEEQLEKATGVKWTHDEGDPGAGYSFIPDEQSLAAKIESSFANT